MQRNVGGFFCARLALKKFLILSEFVVMM